MIQFWFFPSVYAKLPKRLRQIALHLYKPNPTLREPLCNQTDKERKKAKLTEKIQNKQHAEFHRIPLKGNP